MSNSSFFTRNKSIAVFLVMEIMALVSFMFGGIIDILLIAGAAISLIGFVFAFMSNGTRKDFIKLLPAIAVLFIISGIRAFGPFSLKYGSLSLANIAAFFALPAFFSMGFCLRRLGEIKLKNVILVIGAGLGLLTLISAVATWTNYGFFYSLIYKIKGTPLYYYNGTAYDVTKEMYFLVGFKFEEVSIQYGGMFAVLCGSFLSGLLFINPKEDKLHFSLYALIGGIGLLTLLTIPYFEGLAILAGIIGIALILKFVKQNKVGFNIVKGAVAVVLGLGVIFYLLMIINASIGFKFGGILDRLFVSNGIMKKPSEVLAFAFDKDYTGKQVNLFGYNFFSDAYAYSYSMEENLFTNTGIFEFEVIKEVGPIASILLVFFLLAMVYFMYKYIVNENDELGIKAILVTFVFGFFVYETLMHTLITDVHTQGDFNSFFRSAPTMVAFFILGLMYFAPSAKEESK